MEISGPLSAVGRSETRTLRGAVVSCPPFVAGRRSRRNPRPPPPTPSLSSASARGSCDLLGIFAIPSRCSGVSHYCDLTSVEEKRRMPTSCSASTIAAITEKGYHLLKVDGYSLTKDVASGSCIRSRPFTIGGRTWSIAYYPNGVRSDIADYISLYIILVNATDQPVKVQTKFSLLPKSGELGMAVTGTTPVHSFSKLTVDWGYAKFIKKEDLEKPGQYLKDDAFTIRCDIMVVKEFRAEDTKVKVFDPFVVVPPSDLTQHLGDLLSAGEAADVMFNVGGEMIPAHRCVLAARSPVFKAELLGDMKESTTTAAIPIADMEAQVFRAMLHFIYTDWLQETSTAEEEADPVFFQHLLAAADRYNLMRLKLTCEDKLCRHIDVNTAAITLALAEQHHCHGLKKVCLEFLRCPANLKAVMATDGFEYLATRCISIVRELIAEMVD